MEESRQYGGSQVLICDGALQEAALAAAKQALENARERAPVRPSYGEFVFQSRQGFQSFDAGTCHKHVTVLHIPAASRLFTQ